MSKTMIPKTYGKLPGVHNIEFEPVYERLMVTDNSVPFSWLSGYGAYEITIGVRYVKITITSDDGETREWTYSKEKAERFLRRLMEISGDGK